MIKKITIATMFTIARIVLTPVIVWAMIVHYWGVACILFVCAALTDMVDGLIARHFNQKTLLGACLDPIADKFLMISCFCTLAFIDTSLFSIPRWFLIFVISKECMQVMGACWLYRYQGYHSIESTLLGKVTTVIQMVFVTWLLVCYVFHVMPEYSHSALFIALVVCMGMSFVHYAYIGMQVLKKNRGVSYD